MTAASLGKARKQLARLSKVAEESVRQLAEAARQAQLFEGKVGSKTCSQVKLLKHAMTRMACIRTGSTVEDAGSSHWFNEGRVGLTYAKVVDRLQYERCISQGSGCQRPYEQLS